MKEVTEASKPNPSSKPSTSVDTGLGDIGFDEEVQSILEEMEDDKGEGDGKEEITIPVERREDYIFECPPDGRSIMCQLGDVGMSLSLDCRDRWCS